MHSTVWALRPPRKPRTHRVRAALATAGLAVLSVACGPPAPTETPLVTAHNTALAQARAMDAAVAPNAAALVDGLGTCPALSQDHRTQLEHALSQVGLAADESGPVTLPPTCAAALGVPDPSAGPAWLAGVSPEACDWLAQCTAAAAALMAPPKSGTRGPLSPLASETAPLSGSSVDLARQVDDIARAALLQEAAQGGVSQLAQGALRLHGISHAHRRDAGPDQLAVARALEERALVRIGALLTRGALDRRLARSLRAGLIPDAAEADRWHTTLRIAFIEQNRELAADEPALLEKLGSLPGRTPPILPSAADAPPMDLGWTNDHWLPEWRTLLESPPLTPREHRSLAAAAATNVGPLPTHRFATSPFAILRDLQLDQQALGAATCSLRLALYLAELPPQTRRIDMESDAVTDILSEDCAREPVLDTPWRVQDLGSGVAVSAAITNFDRAMRVGLGDGKRSLIERRLADTIQLHR